MSSALILTTPTLFFVANQFQQNLNQQIFRLRILTLNAMSADLFAFRIAKSVLEQCNSENRHTIIKEKRTSVDVLSRKKIQQNSSNLQLWKILILMPKIHELLCYTSSFIREHRYWVLFSEKGLRLFMKLTPAFGSRLLQTFLSD